ncbi:MAG: ribonuclease III [Negativicutes bacterium]|nr:ribonuclease III [Negativicutes bacterium]
MKFDQFQMLIGNVLKGTESAVKQEPARMHPLVLAYIGDAFYSLYVRTRLLRYEQNRVRVLHSFDARIVSAAMQAYGLRAIEPELTEQEMDIMRRGRNAKSTPTRNASVSDYRYSTGLEALMGFLYLSGKHERLNEIAEKVFGEIMRNLANNAQDKGERT